MSVSQDAAYYVGVDWAAEVHAVCVLDHSGKVVSSFPVAHSAEGIAALVARLARLGEAPGIPVGIERPNGRLVDLLLEAGHPVVPVSPNAIKTWREGEVLSGAKSDAGDAAVIAEYLRLRAHRLRVVPGYSAETKALRTVVRTRDDLSRCGSRPLTSSPPCWTRTGPAPRPSSPTSSPRSRWRS